jgi:phosphocarrier protein HPr
VKLVCKVKVKNTFGLHIRPATAIVKLLQKSHSSVFFNYNNHLINARSIMNILALAVKKNSKIQIIVEGKDAENTMSLLMKAFDAKFGQK